MRKVRVAKIIKKGQISIPAKHRIIIKPFEKLGGILNKYAIKDKPIEKIIEIENNIASKMFSK